MAACDSVVLDKVDYKSAKTSNERLAWQAKLGEVLDWRGEKIVSRMIAYPSPLTSLISQGDHRYGPCGITLITGDLFCVCIQTQDAARYTATLLFCSVSSIYLSTTVVVLNPSIKLYNHLYKCDGGLDDCCQYQHNPLSSRHVLFQ